MCVRFKSDRGEDSSTPRSSVNDCGYFTFYSRSCSCNCLAASAEFQFYKKQRFIPTLAKARIVYYSNIYLKQFKKFN